MLRLPELVDLRARQRIDSILRLPAQSYTFRCVGTWYSLHDTEAQSHLER